MELLSQSGLLEEYHDKTNTFSLDQRSRCHGAARYTIAPPGGPIAWRDYVDFSGWAREADGTLVQGTLSCCGFGFSRSELFFDLFVF